MGSDSKLEETIYETIDETVSPPVSESKPVIIDPFLDTDCISGLTNKTFNDFIQHKDATLVMFYYLGTNSSPTTEEKWCKKQFVTAAVSTLRKNSAYAAVNCANESLICKIQDVDTYPTYKLYTKGITVGSIRDKHSADFNLLKSYVDLCPVVGKKRRPEPKLMKPIRLFADQIGPRIPYREQPTQESKSPEQEICYGRRIPDSPFVMKLPWAQQPGGTTQQQPPLLPPPPLPPRKPLMDFDKTKQGIKNELPELPPPRIPARRDISTLSTQNVDLNATLKIDPPPPVPGRSTQASSRNQSSGRFLSNVSCSSTESEVSSCEDESLPPDKYIKSKKVSSLDGYTFKDFLKRKDAALVMFYDKEATTYNKNKWIRKQFVKAARNTDRPNSAFAAVNCTQNPLLCEKEAVNSFPICKIYTKGITVGTIRDMFSADHIFLKRFIDACPLPTHLHTRGVAVREFYNVMYAQIIIFTQIRKYCPTVSINLSGHNSTQPIGK